MLDSHYLFGLSSSIQLKHRIFSFSLFSSLSPIVCEGKDSRLLFALKLFTIVAPSRNPTLPRSTCFSAQTGKGINNIFCTAHPFDRPSLATEIAWYGHQIDKPVST